MPTHISLTTWIKRNREKIEAKFNSQRDSRCDACNGTGSIWEECECCGANTQVDCSECNGVGFYERHYEKELATHLWNKDKDRTESLCRLWMNTTVPCYDK